MELQMTKFVHFRNYRGEGAVIPELDGQYVCTKGGTTVAFKEHKTEEGLRLEYATAHCSIRDNYCRKTGRAIAEGRLNAGKSQNIFVSDEYSPYDLFSDLL
jgi:hypothetical protein